MSEDDSKVEVELELEDYLIEFIHARSKEMGITTDEFIEGILQNAIETYKESES